MSDAKLAPKPTGRGGPSTSEGKAISRLNATKHGLLSAVVPEHEAPAYAEHVALVQAHFKPVGYLEGLLTERVASILWRLGRVARFESAAVQQRVDGAMAQGGWGELRETLTELWEALQDDSSQGLAAMAQDAVQAIQTVVGSASLPNEVVEKVPRYEAHLDRTLRRTLDELNQLQQARLRSFRSFSAPTELL